MAIENPPSVKNRGWSVALSGLGINLALGVLYTWSLFKPAIAKMPDWKASQLNDPYALCCLVFAFTMIVAGRFQDKLGPRLTATIGGVLVGAGMLLLSSSQSYGIWLLGFGVLVGLGLGFGYSAATPAALKWFPPAKTGLIAGLVVAGFGLAPVYLAPTADYLLTHYTLQKSMFILGVAFLLIVCGLSQLLVNPPPGFSTAAPGTAKPPVAGATPGEMLRSPVFYLLWLIYVIGAGAGLMVIGSLSGMAKASMGAHAFVAVAIMAIGNAGGRIVAGILSDKIGRRQTLMLVLGLQAALMFIAIPVTASVPAAAPKPAAAAAVAAPATTVTASPATASAPAPAAAPASSGIGLALIVVLVATMIGFNYGANLALFPSFAKDFWGLKGFGLNYGVLFTAWGVGGFIFPKVQQSLTANSGGSFQSSFIAAGSVLVVGAVLTLFIRPPKAA